MMTLARCAVNTYAQTLSKRHAIHGNTEQAAGFSCMISIHTRFPLGFYHLAMLVQAHAIWGYRLRGGLAQRIAVSALALAIGAFGLFIGPVKAYAETMEEVQGRLQEATAAYDEAQARIAEIEDLIAENEERIAVIEAQLPEQRSAAASSIRTVYKLQQDAHGLLELILSSESFFDFLESIQYLNIIQDRSTQAIDELVSLNAELETRREELSAAREEAIAEREAAQKAIDDAEAAREELERIAAEEAAREEAEREAALAEAAAKAAAKETFTNASGNEVSYIVALPPEENSVQQEQQAQEEQQPQEQQPEEQQPQEQQAESAPAEEPTTTEVIYVETETTSTVTYDARTVFVYVWTQRIDAYLKGTPLSGYGYAFAEAAWDYGVDPRFSPAISYVESSCGAYCFRSHNAWGWGSSSWSNWDTAIRAHVRGLASGYGYTLTYAGAQRYCPPGGAWYSAVAAQMSRIWGSDQI